MPACGAPRQRFRRSGPVAAPRYRAQCFFKRDQAVMKERRGGGASPGHYSRFSQSPAPGTDA